MVPPLFSTLCYIKGDSYNLCICIDDDSESTSNIELSINQKTNSIDNTIPKTITLNKLLHVKQSRQLSNESIQIELSYVNICESFIWTIKRIELEVNSVTGNEFCLILTEYLSAMKHRPRNLLCFVNPQCGKDEGRSIYDKKVFPLFQEAHIDVKTIYTERANHARDYINDNSLDEYDGLISVGGDGMFSELCYSLLLKTAQKSQLDMNEKNLQLIRPNLRIGVIPAGSTDAIAFGTTGHNDPITSALQIILGESLFIDITTVHNEHGFVCFMATMLAYGFFGDIIQQSDKWRFFGPLRYNLAGLFQYARNTSYHTRLTITQPSEKYPSKTLVDNLDQHLFANSESGQKVLDEKSAINESITDSETALPLEIKLEGHYRAINCLNMPCRCEKSKYGMSPSVHLGDGSFDVIVVKRSWRMGLLRFLHSVASDARNIDELSNVERYRATQIIIHPIVNQQEQLGNWSCDGELFTANQVTIRAHHQALNLFASGINPDQIKQINQQNSKIIDHFSIKKKS